MPTKPHLEGAARPTDTDHRGRVRSGQPGWRLRTGSPSLVTRRVTNLIPHRPEQWEKVGSKGLMEVCVLLLSPGTNHPP